MFSNMFFQLTNLFGQSVDLLSKFLFFFFRVALFSGMINVSVSRT